MWWTRSLWVRVESRSVPQDQYERRLGRSPTLPAGSARLKHVDEHMTPVTRAADGVACRSANRRGLAIALTGFKTFVRRPMFTSARWSRFAIASRLLAIVATLFVAPPASAQGPDLAAAKKCFEDIWVRHDTTAVARCQSPSFPEHGTAGDTVTTHASTYAFLRGVFTDYPDMKGTILEQLPHGDRIITRWRSSARTRTRRSSSR